MLQSTFRRNAGAIRFGTATALLGMSLLVVDHSVADDEDGAVLQPGSGDTENRGEAQVDVHPFGLILEGGKRASTLYGSGKRVEMECHTVWRPMCGSRAGSMSEAELRDIARIHGQRFPQEQGQPGDQGEGMGAGDGPDADEGEADGGLAGSGINLIFATDSSVPADAQSAIDEAEEYLESLFDDSINVTIEIDFQTLDPDTLGATGSDYTFISYNMSRNGLQDGMDATDGILNHLPTGSKIPVRYNGNNNNITMENRVFWTIANYRSTIGNISGPDAAMTFNDDFSWDFDPSDGINGYSFQDVLIHEVGHALGFTSGADFRETDMETLDIFRFQRTGGGHDYNPDTTAEFKVRPRLVDFNTPNNDHIVDVITVEHRMSDGSPYQASHFREQDDNIGLMDPAIAAGESFWPSFYSTADLKMFDVIGWDR